MLFLITVLVSVLPAVLSYGYGPPLSVCGSMTPSHGQAQTQTGTSKFFVSVDKASYGPGEEIRVTMSGCGNSQFEGFMLEARRADFDTDTNAAIGTFNTLPGTKGLACGGVDRSAVGHSTDSHRSSLTFTWTAPSSSVGHIVFTVTFLEREYTFWVRVNSQVVRDNSLANPVKPGQLTYPSPATCQVPVIPTTKSPLPTDKPQAMTTTLGTTTTTTTTRTTTTTDTTLPVNHTNGWETLIIPKPTNETATNGNIRVCWNPILGLIAGLYVSLFSLVLSS